MANDLPAEVRNLLQASGPEVRDRAWAAFLDRYNSVLLQAARTVGPEHDAVMDRYAHILEQLRCDDFRRLRHCVGAPPTDFTVWLAVVARRLSLDSYRAIYGRTRPSSSNEAASRRGTRRRLVDLLPGAMDVDLLADQTESSPEETITASERSRALAEALSRLNPRDRLLLRFRFDQECSIAEIARLMAFPTTFHVYRRLNTVLKGLRQDLQAHGID